MQASGTVMKDRWLTGMGEESDRNKFARGTRKGWMLEGDN
jgi:hypothetical protein